MKFFDWDKFRKLRWLLATDSLEPARQAARIVSMQRDIVLPSKAGVLLVVSYFLFYAGWSYDYNNYNTLQQQAMQIFQGYFFIYVACNAIGSLFFIFWRRFPPGLFLWLVFTLALLDGLFVAGMTVTTGGYGSIVFWIFPGLIVLNAISIPLAVPQIVLNLILSLFYMAAILSSPYVWQEQTVIGYTPGRSMTAGHNTNSISGGNGTNATTRTNGESSTNRLSRAVWTDYREDLPPEEEVTTEKVLARLSLLWLLTMCCYGTQVLLERQREAAREAVEFAAREGQLHSAGRLAAEFAHQIKNPIAVINNAAYSLKKSMPENRNSAAQQIEIIQEEVARVDRVITQIMGYAQLSEGRVEKLDTIEQIELAIEQVFPAAVPTDIEVVKTFGSHFPPLLMQRGHLLEIFVNLLQNAREALNGQGTVFINAKCHPDYSVEVTVTDDGPGIPPDKMERIFEAYFTTKEKGTGLGLAIVKHSVELYGGTVRAESKLGKGAKFTVLFPAKSLPKPFAK